VDVLRPVRAFDRFQRRHRPLAIAVAVVRNFSDQGAGKAAALIAYWGFFSLFPLLLAFVAILGFVLQGDPSAQRSIVDSVLRQFPTGVQAARLRGSGVGLAIGLAGSVLSGLGVTFAVQNALNIVYAVPPRRRANFIGMRTRGLRVLVVAGVLQVVSTVAAGAVSGGFGGVVLVPAGIAVSLVLNLCLFFVAFRLLITDVVPTRELRTGIVCASVGWTVLQSVGGLYVAHVIKGASHTYGSFATVIGLLAWLYLGARIVVYSAEVNVVLTRRLWPRSLFEPSEPADRRARAALAKLEERDDHETVTVAFHPAERHDPPTLGDPPYGVAPEPAPGERAVALSPATAAHDTHDLTLEELAAAVRDGLAEIGASDAAKRRAGEWLDRASAALAGADETATALADATRRALGLAGD
jgi:membrane protein